MRMLGSVRRMPGLPRLCPDLSATVYGARVALAAMANALAKPDEAARWLADAEHIRRLILERLYDPKDAAFYDVDAQGNFVRVRSDVISRVLGEHVLKLSEAHDRAVVRGGVDAPDPQPEGVLGAVSAPVDCA